MRKNSIIFALVFSILMSLNFVFASDLSGIDEKIEELYFREITEEEQKELNEKKTIIDVKTQNVKTINYVGEDVDLSNLSFVLTYDDYTKEKVKSNDERIEIDDIDTSEVGLQTIAVYMNRNGVKEHICNYIVKISEYENTRGLTKSLQANFSTDLPDIDDLEEWEFFSSTKGEYYLDEDISESDFIGMIVKCYHTDWSVSFYTIKEDDIEGVEYTKKEGPSDINVILKNGMEFGWQIFWYNRETALNRDNPLASRSNKYISDPEEDINFLNQIYTYSKEELPNKYRLTDTFDIEVANQNPFGYCNLFSFVKAVETNARLKYGYNYNFSERHADYMTSSKLYGTRTAGTLKPFSDGDAFGDDDDLSVGFIHGFALEEDVPYKDYSNMSQVKSADIYWKLNKTINISLDDDFYPEEKIELIKKHIIEYGGLKFGTFVCGGKYWYKNYNGGGHAICIVGWDDDISKELFTDSDGNHPENDGAWIVLNSWGNTWGDNGYFYVSYEHPLGNVVGVIDAEPVEESLDYDTYCNTSKTKNAQVYGFRYYYVTFDVNDGEYLRSIIVDEVPRVNVYIVNNYDGTNIDDYEFVGTVGSVDRLEFNEPLKLEGDRVAVIVEHFDWTTYRDLYKNTSSHTYYSDYYAGLKNEANWSKFTYEMPIFLEKTTEDELNELTVTKIEVEELPSKTMYNLDEDLDVSGGAIKVYYSDGSDELISMTNENVFFYGLTATSKTNDTVTITVLYEGKTDTFEIGINSIERIEIAKYPTKLSHSDNTYSKGFDGTIKAYFSDGSSSEISMMDDAVICYLDGKKINKNNDIDWGKYDTGALIAMVEYYGKTAEFEYEILPSLEEVVVLGYPTKTEYYDGEAFDETGFSAELTFTDGSKKVVYTMNDIVEATDGFSVPYVNWRRAYDGVLYIGETFITLDEVPVEPDYMIMFEFTVIAEPEIEKIEMETLPAVTRFDSADVASIVESGEILIIYSDETSRTKSIGTEDVEIYLKDETGEKIAIENPKKVSFKDFSIGTNTIYVSYKDFETSFEITVGKTMTGFSVKTEPKTEYVIGDAISYEDGEIEVSYSNNETVTYSFDDEEFSELFDVIVVKVKNNESFEIIENFEKFEEYGEYLLIVVKKGEEISSDNYESIEISVSRIKLTVPELKNDEYEFKNEEITPELDDNYSGELITLGGQTSGKNVGKYHLTMNIKDTTKYEWDVNEEETTTTRIIEWEIIPASLEVTYTEGTTLEYTGEAQEFNGTIEGFDENLMELSGDLVGTDAGEYNIRVELKDTNNYAWKSEVPSFTWKIEKGEWNYKIENATQKEKKTEDLKVVISPALKDGTVKVMYADKDGNYSEQRPTKAGTYGVKISVVGDSNLQEIEKEDSMTIKKASAPAPAPAPVDSPSQKPQKDDDSDIKEPEKVEDDKITSSKVFTDVKPTDWYYEAVTQVVEEGLFNGTTEDTFSPQLNLTRGMLVTVLYRLAGATDTSLPEFGDVDNTMYYASPIAWASKNKIVNGVGDGNFAPDSNITREDLATIVYRFAKLYKKDFVDVITEVLQYVDTVDISDYARIPIAWCSENGILNGKENNRVDPKGLATRAETAAILQRVEKLMK